MQGLLMNNQTVVYLDKKWFYTMSHRLHVLTSCTLQRPGRWQHPHPKSDLLSSSCKWEVTKHIQQHNFDTQAGYNRCFHISRLVNNQRKDGDQRHLHLPNDDFNFGTFKMLIAENFELDEDVGEPLEFRYSNYNGDGSRRKIHGSVR